jgi:hypothetical protein
MKTRMSFIIYIMVCCSFLSQQFAWGLPSKNKIELDGDRISIHVHGIKLSQLLSSVSEKTGIPIWLDESLADQSISLNLKAEPLDEGMRRITARLNSATIYDSSGNIARVYVMGKAQNWLPSDESHHQLPVNDDDPEAPSVPMVGSDLGPPEASPPGREAPITVSAPADTNTSAPAVAEAVPSPIIEADQNDTVRTQ